MTEQITIQVEIDGGLQEADVTFRFFGPTAVHIDEVFLGDRAIDDLTLEEEQAVKREIVDHKLSTIDIGVKR